MDKRIKELRKSRHLTQQQFSKILSVTQQNISKYENNIYDLPVDIMIKMANYFNVTIGYLLGVSDIKRDTEGQTRVNQALDEYYDWIEIVKTLNKDEKELMWTLIEKLQELKMRKE